MFHHKLIFLPAFLIIIGILALLTNLGIVTATIWNWWPILFVILGVYILIWQKRKKRVLKGLAWYSTIHRIIKEKKLDKLLENELVKKELKKVGDIVEGVISDQIDKLHAKYAEKQEPEEKKFESETPEMPEK